MHWSDFLGRVVNYDPIYLYCWITLRWTHNGPNGNIMNHLWCVNRITYQGLYRNLCIFWFCLLLPHNWLIHVLTGKLTVCIVLTVKKKSKVSVINSSSSERINCVDPKSSLGLITNLIFSILLRQHEIKNFV